MAGTGAFARPADTCGIVPQLTEKTLTNGLRVVVAPSSAPNIVALEVVVDAGSRRESAAGSTGIAQVVERLMAPVTTDSVATQHATLDDYTSFGVTFVKRDLASVIATQADRFRGGSWTDQDFRREAREIEAEYRRLRATPVFRVFETQREVAFRTHPYRHARFGAGRDVGNLHEHAADARAFFDRWYRPEHTTIVIAGDVDPASVIALVEQHWGSWSKAGFDAEVPKEAESKTAATSHIRWDTPANAWVTVAFRSPAFSADDREFASLAAAMETWFGPHSALYKRLVVDEEKVEQLGVDMMTTEDPGLATVYARVRTTKDFLYVRDRILETAARARATEVAASRFAAVQSNARYALAASLDEPAAIAATIAPYARFAHGAETLNRYACTRAAITAADVRAAAERFFVDEGLIVVTLANERRPVELEKLPPLATFAPAAPDRDTVAGGHVDVVVQQTESPRVLIKVQFAAGSGRDPIGREGLAQLAASMIVGGGSSAMPVEDAREALYAIGGAIDVKVDKELTTFTLSAHRDQWSRLLDLTLPMLLDPALPRDIFRTSRSAQQDALQDLIADDFRAGSELLQQAAYHGLPYGHPTFGTVDGIDTTTLADVRDFIRRHYTTGNLHVGVSGDAPAALVNRLRSELGRLPGGRDAELPTTRRSATGLRVDLYDKEAAVSSITLGQAVSVDRSHHDWAALTVASLVLGDPGSATSRLRQSFSAARHVSDGACASLEPSTPSGRLDDPERARRGSVFVIAIRAVAPKNTAMAVRLAAWEFRKLVEQGISEDEFQRARKAFLASLELASNDDRRLTETLAARALDRSSDTIREKLSSLTRSDVNRAIREHLHAANLFAVVIAPGVRDRRVELLRNTPPFSYSSEPAKSVRAEDATIAALDLELEPEDVRLYPITDAFAE